METVNRGIGIPVLNASPLGISKVIAARFKARRLQEGWSRETLAARAGISQWTVKHFESTGQIALATLIKAALVLNESHGFVSLFPAKSRMPMTMADLEKLHPPLRKRQGMTKGLVRYYGTGHLHFITCSCYRRQPQLHTARRRDLFLRILEQTRRKYRFVVHGYVVMPEHFHLLITEPERGHPARLFGLG